MEFPHIGKNCSYKSCNKLDFLPMKCDACREVFCSDHFTYLKHECQASNTRNVQVPECPLCGAPVPGKRGEAPDIAVGAHIDNQCTSDPARERRNKVFTNRCSFKGCKAKEMVPLVCGECSLNYCLRHRHAADHSCEGKLAAKRRQLANAAMARMKAAENKMLANNTTLNAPVSTFNEVQGNMSLFNSLSSLQTRPNRITRYANWDQLQKALEAAIREGYFKTEDEALAHALALSMQEQSGDLHAQDTNMARILARQRVGGEQSSRCNIS